MTTELERRPTPEEIRLGQQAIEIYRGWARADKFLDQENGIEVIETDLVDIDFERIDVTSRPDAISQLASLRNQITPGSPFSDYLNSAITSSITLSQAIDGQTFELSDYSRKTIGIEPQPTTKDELDEQQEIRDEEFSAAGFAPTPENYDHHFNRDRISPDEVIREFKEASARLVPIVARTLGLSHLLPLEYTQEFVSLDAPWTFHMTHRRGGSKLELNNHPNVRWVKGRPEELSYHELAGHQLQYLYLRENIENGTLNSAYGVIQAPGPLSWQDEGIACTLPSFIPELYEAMSPIGRFMAQAYHLNRMVMNNLHIMANEGIPTEEIKKFAKHYLPYETDERLERQIKIRSQNPCHRAYQLTYCDGAPYFASEASELGPEKSIVFLITLYRRPMTPDQVKNLVATLKG